MYLKCDTECLYPSFQLLYQGREITDRDYGPTPHPPQFAAWGKYGIRRKDPPFPNFVNLRFGTNFNIAAKSWRVDACRVLRIFPIGPCDCADVRFLGPARSLNFGLQIGPLGIIGAQRKLPDQV